MTKEQLLTLPRFHNDINTCTDDNLEMICEKLNRIYALSFFELWDFSFKDEGKLFSEKIYLNNEINYNNVKRFNGIELEDINVKCWEDAQKEIRKSLEYNNPIMLHMYRRLFPWDVNFENKNVPDFFTHKAMAVDINEKDILFTDGYCNKYYEKLSIDTCKKSTNGKLTKIYVEENYNIDLIQYFNLFKKNQKSKVNMFYNMKKFSEELNGEKIQKELKENLNEMYQYSHIKNSLNKLTRSRRKIQKLLRDLAESFNNMRLYEFSHDFDKTILNFEYLNLCFEKYSITENKKNLEKASSFMEQIINIEKELFFKLDKIEIF